MEERDYDRLCNEGGEGYNPYREKRLRERSKIERAHELEWLRTHPETTLGQSGCPEKEVRE